MRLPGAAWIALTVAIDVYVVERTTTQERFALPRQPSKLARLLFGG